jgi:serpin B
MSSLRRKNTLVALLGAAAMAVLAISTTGGATAAPHHAASQHKVPLGPGPVIVPSTGPAVYATNRLGLGLLRDLGGNGNLVVSPYSVETALAMVDQGAAGSTESEIDHLLSVSWPGQIATDDSLLRQALRAAVRDHGAHGPTFDDANNLWVQSGFALESPFSSTLSGDFGVTPQSADFENDPSGARSAINAWVAAHTGKLINHLMPAGSITALTRLVLANAIYLKAKWESPFQAGNTADRDFFPAAGAAVRTPFMSQIGFFSYHRGAQYTAVELPYANSSLSFLAVMPTSGTIAGFEHKLTPRQLNAIASGLASANMSLSVPKLDLSIDSNLNGVLSKLGMSIAFENGANFSGISKKVQLVIQDVEHDAVLKVDEAGTVAAAATGISVGTTAIEMPPPLHVTLDHPFLVFLRDDKTGAVLFAARVANPAS